MAGGMRTGFLIAALVAAAFLGFSFFGTRHENWFLRAAQENAVRCLTKSPCTSLTAQSGIVPNARPPLSYASACAKPGDWQQLKSVSNDKTRIGPDLHRQDDLPLSHGHFAWPRRGYRAMDGVRRSILRAGRQGALTHALRGADQRRQFQYGVPIAGGAGRIQDAVD